MHSIYQWFIMMNFETTFSWREMWKFQLHVVIFSFRVIAPFFPIIMCQMAFTIPAWLSRIHINCKRLHIIITYTRFYSLCRLGAWQFLADMPFRSVSSDTLWKLFSALHLDIRKLDSVASIQREELMRNDWREVLEGRYIAFNVTRYHLSRACMFPL